MDPVKIEDWNKRALSMTSQGLLLLEYITKSEPKWRPIFVRKKHFYKDAVICTICETAGISGIKSLQQHISGKRHQQKLKSTVIGIRQAEVTLNSENMKEKGTKRDDSQLQNNPKENAAESNNKDGDGSQPEKRVNILDVETFRSQLITLKLEDLLKVEYKYINTDWKHLIEKKENLYHCSMCKNIKLDNISGLRNHFRNRQHSTNILLVKMLHHPNIFPNKPVVDETFCEEIVDLTDDKSKSGSDIVESVKSNNPVTSKDNCEKNSEFSKGDTTKTSTDQSRNNEDKNKNSEITNNKIFTSDKSQSSEIPSSNKEKETSLQENIQNRKEESSTINTLTICDSVAVSTQDTSSKILNDEEFREMIPKLSMIEINEVEYLAKQIWLKLLFCGENNYSCFLCGLLNAKGGLTALRCHFAGRMHKEKLSVAQAFFHSKYTKSKKELEQQSNTDCDELNTQKKETDIINLDEYLSPEENLISPNKDLVLNPAKLALKTRQQQNTSNNVEKIISPRLNSFNNSNELEKTNISKKTVSSSSNQESRTLLNVENEKKQEKIIIPRVNFGKKSTTNFYERDYQRIDETNEGFIGVEYVVKILKTVNDTSPRFECCLCEGEMNASGMQLHLKSLSHRRKYLERHFPTCMRQYQQYSKHKNFDYLLNNVTKKLAIAIEKYHGRDLPFECLEDEYRLNRDGIVSKVFSFRHSSEICGPSFTNIVDKKTIDDLINDTNFKRKLSPQNDYLQRKRTRERSPVLDVEEHKKLVEAFLENTRRGYKQRSTSPFNNKSRYHERSRTSTSRSFRNDSYKSRSRSRSRSPPVVIIDTNENWQNYRRMLTHAMEDLDRDYEEYKKNPESHPDYNSEWKAYWLEKSNELCDEGREPSTYNFQPGWIRFFSKRIFELYDEAVKKLKKTLKRKLSLPLDIGSPRIEDNIVLPKQNVFDTAFQTVSYPIMSGQFSSDIPQQNTMSMPFTHNNSEIALAKPISYPVANISIQNDNTRTLMQSKQNSRPSFGEQHGFTQSESLNSDRYSPHWENTNQDEPAIQEGRSRNEKNLDKTKKGQDQDKERNRSRQDKSPFVDSYSLRDKSDNRFNPTSSRRHSSDFDDSPEDNTYSISVLRLLTALEDHLGILGPRVVNLLSEALTLEKVKPNSVDEELLNRENYVFLETVREKLRGQILANVLDGPKERAIKKCLKDLQILLKKVGDKHLKASTTMQSERSSTVISSTARNESIKTSSTSNNSNIIVNKEEIATKLAAALAAQGKTDITPDELKQLIAVYTLIEQKQQEANNATSQPSTSRGSNTVQKSNYGGTLPRSTQKKSLSDTLLDILKSSNQDNNKSNTIENPQARSEFSGRINQSDQMQRRMQSSEQVNRGLQSFRQTVQDSFRNKISSTSTTTTSNITTRQQPQISSNVVPNVGTNSNIMTNSYYQQKSIPNSYNFTQSNQQQQPISDNASYGQYNLQQQKTNTSNMSMNSQFWGLSQFDTSLRVDREENISASLNTNFSRRSGDQVHNFGRYSMNQSGQAGITFRNSNLNPGASNNFNNGNNNNTNTNTNTNTNINPRQPLPVKVWQNQMNPWTRNW